MTVNIKQTDVEQKPAPKSVSPAKMAKTVTVLIASALAQEDLHQIRETSDGPKHPAPGVRDPGGPKQP